MSGGIYQSFSKNDTRNFPRYNYHNFFLFPEQRFRIREVKRELTKEKSVLVNRTEGVFVV